jgi:NAD(P)-dependent dehydrogenase (short-subunit alcohol dehydrogenase family)
MNQSQQPLDHQPSHILVTGASGGIGRALLGALLESFPGARFHGTHYRSPVTFTHERVQWQQIDLRNQDAIADWAQTFDRVDWLLNCAGFLHDESGGPEKSIRAVNSDFLLESVRVNTLPTLLLAKYFAAALKRSPAPLLATVSARVGSIEDNRLGGWYSYRMSKAALNMALKTLSIEWKHSHPRGCIAALHPGTNDTALSKPFQANVAQKNLFRPEYTAAMLVKLLARLQPTDSGNFWAWDGTRIAW